MLAAAFIWIATLLPPGADRPVYVVETAPAKTIEAILTLEVLAPKLTAKEWTVLAVRAPELPCQIDVHSTLEPNGKDVEDLSRLHRPMLLARIPGGKESGASMTVRVQYEATLLSRRLEPLKPGQDTKVPPLEDAVRKAALRTSKTLDFEAKPFQKWLDTEGQRRRSDEGDVDFAGRVFQHITKHYAYEYRDDLKREASIGCRLTGTDCGGMAVLFVATLRASQVPARVLVGRWAESAVRGDEAGAMDLQNHVKAEFYAEGVGWVPADLSSAVVWDKSKSGLRYFGKDSGNFLVLHVDPDLVADSGHFGKQQVAWLQGPVYWVTGPGSLEGKTERQDWQVRDKQKK